MIVMLAGLCWSCSTPKPEPAAATASPLDLPGPTLMTKVADGYELMNRHIRLVIDEKTGDAIHWGSADGSIDVLHGRPMRSWLSDSGVATPDGYVEKRDDQTWQYIGEDKPSGIGWRRTYCLDGEHAYVTFLIQNQRPGEVTTAIGLLPTDPPSFGPGDVVWQPDQYEATTSPVAGGVGVTLRAFNERHPSSWAELFGEAATRPAVSPLIVSDLHHLKPGERISWTMDWSIDIPQQKR
jgi:hypothetical protein